VRSKRVWKRLLGVEHTVVDDVFVDEATDAIVALVRPTRSRRGRCGICGCKRPGYDQGEGRRRWRALDLGVVQAFVEADAPRVACPAHGVVVAAVPWARHGAGFTRAFEDTTAWLAVHTSRVAVAELLRIGWRSVGRVCERVAAEQARRTDRFAGLRRIGIDEISHRKGQRYLTVVVDHATGRLVWAAPGRDEQTLDGFLDALGAERCARIELVSADAAGWIANVVARRCPAARVCLTRSTSSRGPPTRWTRSAARSGTPPGGVATPRWPASSRAPASRCGRTRRTSPAGSAASWPASPRSTGSCTAPTC